LNSWSSSAEVQLKLHNDNIQTNPELPGTPGTRRTFAVPSTGASASSDVESPVAPCTCEKSAAHTDVIELFEFAGLSHPNVSGRKYRS